MLARTSWLTAVALCVLTGGAIDGAAQTLDWQRSRLPFPHDVTGHGVTIAHLADLPASHPDIATNETRQVWFVDPTADHWTKDDFERAGGEEVVHDLAIETLMAGDGRFRGVAPDANLLVVKGYQTRARANDDHAPATNDSNGLAALIRWVADQQAKYQIRVLTGSFFQYDTFLDRMDPWEASPICRAVEYANAQGIVVVWGVGNARWYSPIAPCYCPSILSVGGATDGWENRGWSIYHHTVGTALDGRRMPDLLAPCDTPWPLPLQKKDAVRSRFQPPGSPLVGFRDDYGFGAGTSYSGPYVAAVAALCLEANPKLAPADVRRILLATADPMPGVPAQQQGAGLVNPRRAVARAQTTRPSAPATFAPTLIPDHRIVDALTSDDPRSRSVALLSLFKDQARDVKFAETLLPLLQAPYPEVVCGALAYLRKYPSLRKAVLSSGLDQHTSLHVRFNWGRITLSESDSAARAVAVQFLKSGQVDLMQLAAYQAGSLRDLGLARPLLEAMMAHPENLQVQSLGWTALEKITGQRMAVPKELDGASQAVRNEAVRKQWHAWLDQSGIR